MKQWRYAHILWTVLMLLPAGGRGQSLPDNNLLVLHHLIIEPLVQMVWQTVPPRERIYLSVSGQTGLARWITDTTVPLLLAKKFRVYKTDNDSVNYRIGVTGARVRITYRPLARNWLTRVTRWQRRIEVRGTVEIVTSAGEVKGVQQLQSDYEDILTISPRQLENVEYPFTRGQVDDTTRWKKWVEPILISAATITVVALFFTIRSQQR